MKNYLFLFILILGCISCDQFAVQEGKERGNEYERKYNLSSKTFQLIPIDSVHIVGYEHNSFEEDKLYFKWILQDTMVNYFTYTIQTGAPFSTLEIRQDTAKRARIEFIISEHSRSSSSFFDTGSDLQNYIFNYCTKIIIHCDEKTTQSIKKDSISAYKNEKVE